MSMAQRLTYSRTVGGNAAPKLDLPVVERAPEIARRPARQRNRRGLLIAGGLTWAVLMTFSLALVHLNSLIHTETSAITRAREELSLLQQKNAELEGRLVQAQSVAAVEKWALSKGMTRPTTIGTLKITDSGLAHRPVPPADGQGPKTSSVAGLWVSLRAMVTRMASSFSLVSSPK